MPRPVSVTSISACPSAACARTSTCPPAGVNLTAFDSRFQNTCRSRAASPRTAMSGSSAMSVDIVTPLVSAVGWIASSAENRMGASSTGSPRQPQLAERDARDVEQIFDQRGLRPGVAVDHFERLRARLVVERPRPQQRDPADNRVQRRAQLVRERAEEVVLDAIGFVRFVARGLLERDGVAQRAFRAAQPQQRVRGRDENVRRHRLDEKSVGIEPVVVDARVGIRADGRIRSTIALAKSSCSSRARLNSDAGCREGRRRARAVRASSDAAAAASDRCPASNTVVPRPAECVPARRVLDASRSTMRMRPPFTSTMHGPGCPGPAGVQPKDVQPRSSRGTLTTDLIREEPKHDDPEGHA